MCGVHQLQSPELLSFELTIGTAELKSLFFCKAQPLLHVPNGFLQTFACAMSDIPAENCVHKSSVESLFVCSLMQGHVS